MARRKKRKQAWTQKAKPKSEVSLAQPRWDRGADGQANRIGLVEEPVTWTDDEGNEVNPNGVKRLRRVDMLENYYRRGWISQRGFSAGEKLRNAWEAVGKVKAMDFKQDRVDSTPKPDQHVAIQVDRVSHLVSLSKHIPDEYAEIILTVAREGRGIAALPQYRGSRHEGGKVDLHNAFEALAEAMGL